MQRRTFLVFFMATLAACGGAHDGSANLEPDHQPALAPAAPASPQAAPAAAPVTGQGG